MKVNTMVNGTEAPMSHAERAEKAAHAAYNGTRAPPKYKDEPLYDAVRSLADLSGDSLLYEKANIWLDEQIKAMGPRFRPSYEKFLQIQDEIHDACQEWEGVYSRVLRHRVAASYCQCCERMRTTVYREIPSRTEP